MLLYLHDWLDWVGLAGVEWWGRVGGRVGGLGGWLRFSGWVGWVGMRGRVSGTIRLGWARLGGVVHLFTILWLKPSLPL